MEILEMLAKQLKVDATLLESALTTLVNEEKRRQDKLKEDG